LQSELQNSDFNFLLYCKLKWYNEPNRGELVLAKFFHAIQQNWFYWLKVTGMRLIPVRFSVVKLSTH
jgi:hypothetical protein